MIDYFKINSLGKGSEILYKLDFEGKYNERTGEVCTNRKRSAHLKNLIFTITPGNRSVKVQGSVHKYSNGGDLNNDRFTFAGFLKVAEELKEYISPDDLVNILEFGANIRTPFNPTDFIKNLICHKVKQFNKTLIPGMSFSEVQYSQFILKIYDKSLQQGPEGENILRIEAKYLKMQKLFPGGLKWAYLSDPETWVYLGAVLKQRFSEVVYYDPTIDFSRLSSSELSLIKKGNNPRAWENPDPHLSRIRKQYQGLVIRFGNKFNMIPELLNQEINEMVKSYQFAINETEPSIIIEKPAKVKSYPLVYSNNSPTLINAPVCLITGLSIKDQRPGSKFLCISGIKKLKNEDPERFEELRNERLSAKWLRYPLKVQFREIGHSIRNEYYNPKNNSRAGVQRLMKDPLLFDILPLIREDKRILAGV